jgi:hypothetical protein
MDLTLINEIWSELKRHLESGVKQEAADDLVSLLIDHGCSAEDIKEAFSDRSIKKALTEYVVDVDEEHHSEGGYDDYDESSWD